MPTGIQIKISTAKMTAVAQVVNNQMSIIKNCFDNIREQSSGLRGNFWEGASADVYHNNMIKLCSEQPGSGSVSAGYIIQALQEYVSDLRKAASAFDKTENNIQTRNQALPIDVFGI